jgi:hypothetical protein
VEFVIYFLLHVFLSVFDVIGGGGFCVAVVVGCVVVVVVVVVVGIVALR